MIWIRLTKGFDLRSTATAWMQGLADFYNRKGIDLCVKPDPIGRSFYVWRTTNWRDHSERAYRYASNVCEPITLMEYLKKCDSTCLWDGVGDPPPDNYAIGALERAEAAKTPKRKAEAV
jgi:hypothetical protein